MTTREVDNRWREVRRWVGYSYGVRGEEGREDDRGGRGRGYDTRTQYGRVRYD